MSFKSMEQKEGERSRLLNAELLQLNGRFATDCCPSERLRPMTVLADYVDCTIMWNVAHGYAPNAVMPGMTRIYGDT